MTYKMFYNLTLNYDDNKNTDHLLWIKKRVSRVFASLLLHPITKSININLQFFDNHNEVCRQYDFIKHDSDVLLIIT